MEDKKLKLIIQIPCLNEADTLPGILQNMPKKIEGIGVIETLVINDGSVDETEGVAKSLGVDHIVNFARRKGLAKAFIAGIDTALQHGADIIVNIDGDGQYDPHDIPKLVRPIVEGRSGMVIGDRDIVNIKHFSFIKKRLQVLGSWVVKKISNINIPDVTSGFRAFSKDTALSMTVLSDFTYTIETLIQAGTGNVALSHVRIKANPVIRKSRLFKTIGEYMSKSISTIIRIYTMYRPFKVFAIISSVVFSIGLFFFARFLYLYMTIPGERPIQHLIVVGVFMLLGFYLFLIGLIADLISANRKLIEDTLKRVKKLELSKGE